MGWMGGLGEGMIQYSQTLGKQRELDWQSEQARLKDMRAMNMQNLQNQFTTQRDAVAQQNAEKNLLAQNQAALERQQAGFEHAEGLFAAGEESKLKMRQSDQAFAQGQQSSNMVNKDTGQPYTEAQLKNLSDAERANLVPASVFQKKMTIETAVEADAAVKAQGAAKRMSEYDALMETPEGQAMSPQKQAQMKMYAISPEFAAIAFSKKSAIGEEEATRLFLNAEKRFAALPKEEMKAVEKAAAGAGINVNDPAEVEAFYIDRYLENAASKILGKQVSTAGTSQKVVKVPEAAMNNARQNPSLVTQEDVDKVTDPEQKAELTRLMQSAGKEVKPPQKMPGASTGMGWEVEGGVERESTGLGDLVPDFIKKPYTRQKSARERKAMEEKQRRGGMLGM